MGTIRQNTITNTVAALIPSGNVAIVCNTGQDYGFECVERTIVTAEIGTGAGQTRDTSSNPTTGFLFAQFQGANIKRVVSAFSIKSSAATNTTVFERFVWATGAGTSSSSLGFRIVNPSDSSTTPGWDANYSSLFLLDAGSSGPSQIANGDKVRVLVELGNS